MEIKLEHVLLLLLFFCFLKMIRDKCGCRRQVEGLPAAVDVVIDFFAGGAEAGTEIEVGELSESEQLAADARARAAARDPDGPLGAANPQRTTAALRPVGGWRGTPIAGRH